MRKDTWIDHLTHWEEFLHVRLQTVEEKGEAEKIERQLKTLKSIRLFLNKTPTFQNRFHTPPLCEKPFTMAQMLRCSKLDHCEGLFIYIT